MRYNAGMLRRLPVQILRFAAALGIILAIVFLYEKVFPVNQTAVALTFLLAILAVSTVWGFAVSAFMSVVAMVAFNYFFLPPRAPSPSPTRRTGWRSSFSWRLR